MFHLARNFVSWISTRGEMHVNILMLGLDGAGKTTLSHGLKGELPPENLVPTMGFNFHKREDGRRKVKFTDLGGGSAMRKIWESYMDDAHGVIFVIDAADRDRFSLAAQTFAQVVGDGSALAGKPLLVFANKQDLAGAANAREISQALRIDAVLSNAGLSDYAVMEGVAIPRGGSDNNNNIGDDDIENGAYDPGTTDASVHEAYTWAMKRVSSRYTEIQEIVEKAVEERAKKKPVKSTSETQKRLEAIRARRKKEEAEEAARKAAEEANGGGGGGDGVGSNANDNDNNNNNNNNNNNGMVRADPSLSNPSNSSVSAYDASYNNNNNNSNNHNNSINNNVMPLNDSSMNRSVDGGRSSSLAPLPPINPINPDPQQGDGNAGYKGKGRLDDENIRPASLPGQLNETMDTTI